MSVLNLYENKDLHEFDSDDLNIYPQKTNKDLKGSTLQKTPTVLETVAPRIQKKTPDQSHQSQDAIFENLLGLSTNDMKVGQPGSQKNNDLQQPDFLRIGYYQNEKKDKHLENWTDLDFLNDLSKGNYLNQGKRETNVEDSLKAKHISSEREFTFGDSLKEHKTSFGQDEKKDIAAQKDEISYQHGHVRESKRENKWRRKREIIENENQKNKESSEILGGQNIENLDMLPLTQSIITPQKDQNTLDKNSNNTFYKPFERGHKMQVSTMTLDLDDDDKESVIIPQKMEKYEVEENLVQKEETEEEYFEKKYPSLGSSLGSWKFQVPMYTFQAIPTTTATKGIVVDVEEALDENDDDEIKMNQEISQDDNKYEEAQEAEELEEAEVREVEEIKEVNKNTSVTEEEKPIEEIIHEPEEVEKKDDEEEEEKIDYPETESIAEIKKNFTPPKDNRFSTEERKETLELANNTATSGAIDEGFADDEILYTLGNDPMGISKHISTQTKENELFNKNDVLGNQNITIKILEAKLIDDGMLKSHTEYTIETSSKEDKSVFQVHRRYNDFAFLFDYLEKKYKGHILPLLPEKNVLATINKESMEFAEKRKKGLITFLNKCLEHPEIRTKDEFYVFLTEDKVFKSFMAREQKAEISKKGYGIYNFFTKITSKFETSKAIIREKTSTDNEFDNYQLVFRDFEKILDKYQSDLQSFLQLHKQKTSYYVSFLQQLEHIDNKNVEKFRRSKHEGFKEMHSQLSKKEDWLNENLTKLVESQLEDIIQDVKAVNYALEKRKELVEELYQKEAIVEEKRLEAKKNSGSDEEIKGLIKEYEDLKKVCEKASLCLLEEMKREREKIKKGLLEFTKSFQDNNERGLNQVKTSWVVNAGSGLKKK